VTGAGAPTPLNFNMNVLGDLVINGTTGSSGQSLDDYLLAVTASNVGQISVSFTNTGNVNEIPLAGVAIRGTVPEPGAVLLLATCGVLGLAVSRRLRAS
jgi:hypothetical protein